MFERLTAGDRFRRRALDDGPTDRRCISVGPWLPFDDKSFRDRQTNYSGRIGERSLRVSPFRVSVPRCFTSIMYMATVRPSQSRSTILIARAWVRIQLDERYRMSKAQGDHLWVPISVTRAGGPTIPTDFDFRYSQSPKPAPSVLGAVFFTKGLNNVAICLDRVLLQSSVSSLGFSPGV